MAKKPKIFICENCGEEFTCGPRVAVARWCKKPECQEAKRQAHLEYKRQWAKKHIVKAEKHKRAPRPNGTGTNWTYHHTGECWGCYNKRKLNRAGLCLRCYQRKSSELAGEEFLMS